MTVTSSSICLQGCHDVTEYLLEVPWGDSILHVRSSFLLRRTWLVKLLNVLPVSESDDRCDHSAHGSAFKDTNPTPAFSSVHSAPFSECPAQCHMQNTEQSLLLMVSILRKGKRSSILQQASLSSKTKAGESTIRLACCYLLFPFPIIFMNQFSSLVFCEGSIFEDVF